MNSIDNRTAWNKIHRKTDRINRSGHVCLKEVEIMEREQQELLQKIAAAGTASGEYHRKAGA